MELAEAREVREVQELLSCHIHALEVQREVQAQHTRLLEGILAQRHIVAIRAGGRAEACMCLVRHGTDAMQGDVVGEVAISAEDQLTCCLEIHRQIDVSDHTTGMDASIRAPSADDSDGLGRARDERQRLLDSLLDGRSIGLGLPAAVVRAVVAQRDEVAHLQLSSSTS